jgi:hypothetical protein
MDKRTKKILEYSENLLKKPITEKEAKDFLISAGILTKSGKHTKPYKSLDIKK